MVVYLPIAFIKDWICNLLKTRSSKSGKNTDSIMDESSCILNSPLKYIEGQKAFEMEFQGNFTRKDSEEDFSAQEDGRPLVPKLKEDTDMLKQDKALTTREIALCGFYIAPIWFITEVMYFFFCSISFLLYFLFLTFLGRVGQADGCSIFLCALM